MKSYVSFIKENKENEDLKVDYNKLKKLIVYFENGINIGFGDQFVGIINRTPEDVKSISEENSKKMEQEKEQQKSAKDEEQQQKKQSDKQHKISVALSQLLSITYNFPKIFGNISNEVRKLKDTKGEIDIDAYKNMYNNIKKLKISKEDQIKIQEFRTKDSKKEKHLSSISKLLQSLNQNLGVKVENTVEDAPQKDPSTLDSKGDQVVVNNQYVYIDNNKNRHRVKVLNLATSDNDFTQVVDIDDNGNEINNKKYTVKSNRLTSAGSVVAPKKQLTT